MSAFPGLDDPLITLSLLAIEPQLKGVLIAGPPGTGKSTIARAAKKLFPSDKPFVNIPLSCTLDRLVGGIDMERTAQAGKIVALPGLLAQAHGGVVYVDEINLLPQEILSSLTQALMLGYIRLEREGISQRFAAQFVLIGTYNPLEAELSASVTERVAFRVWTRTLSHLSWRIFLAAHRDSAKTIPIDVVQRVKKARQIYPQVQMHHDQLEKLCAMASNSGVEGNRAENFAYLCAKANAALHLRVPVTEQDLHLAMRLIFLSRLGSMPLPGEDELETNSKSQKSNRQQKAPDQVEQEAQQEAKNTKNQPKEPKDDEPLHDGLGKDQQAQAKKEPLEVSTEESGPIDIPKINTLTTNSRRMGKHLAGLNYRRGRFVRAVAGDPKKGKLDILASIKAALHAHPLHNNRDKTLPIRIKKEHFRIKQYRQQSGLLFLFAVDGSGSMAINNYGAAKGAALHLLQKAYIYRDQVAMMFFRRDRADVLLQPGSSLTKAYRILQRIPAGGRTPLSHAMMKCIQMAKKAQHTKEVAGVVLILFTDGRANQPLKPISEGQDRETMAMKELQPLCKELQKHLCAALVIDTKRLAYQNQKGKDIAHWLGAQYMYLPKATASDISKKLDSKINDWR